MTAKEMLYALKVALDKVDSRDYANLRVPSLDRALNEAALAFTKFVAQPRLARQAGYESSSRNIHDIRTLVKYLNGTPLPQSDGTALLSLPSDFLFYTKCKSLIKRGTCSVNVTCTYIEFDDDEQDTLYKSSFDWQILNVRLDSRGLIMYKDSDFIIGESELTYIKQPQLIHNAQEYGTGTYTTGAGQILTGSQDSDLPEHTHIEIVRLAALFLTGDLQMPDYQVKSASYQLSIQ